MSLKSDGERIQIRFSNKLINKETYVPSSMTISFKTPQYAPNGSLEDASRTCSSFEFPHGVDEKIDLTSGTFHETQYFKSGIILDYEDN